VQIDLDSLLITDQKNRLILADINAIIITKNFYQNPCIDYYTSIENVKNAIKNLLSQNNKILFKIKLNLFHLYHTVTWIDLFNELGQLYSNFELDWQQDHNDLFALSILSNLFQKNLSELKDYLERLENEHLGLNSFKNVILTWQNIHPERLTEQRLAFYLWALAWQNHQQDKILKYFPELKNVMELGQLALIDDIYRFNLKNSLEDPIRAERFIQYLSLEKHLLDYQSAHLQEKWIAWLKLVSELKFLETLKIVNDYNSPESAVDLYLDFLRIILQARPHLIDEWAKEVKISSLFFRKLVSRYLFYGEFDDRVLSVLKNFAQKEFVQEVWEFLRLQNEHQVDIKRLIMLKSSLSALTRA
jgi:hypothetical protein